MIPTMVKVIEKMIEEGLEKKDPVAYRLALEKIRNYIKGILEVSK